jgi:hypothetical protein
VPPGGNRRTMFRIERKSEPVLSWPLFVRRLGLSLGVGAGLIAGSLAAGMAGYHYLEELSWLDAFLNAAMILSGMGPLAQTQTVAGKVFAGLYALYSGFAVLVIAGIAFGPVVHRMLHIFHADDPDLEDKANQAGATRGRQDDAVTMKPPPIKF